MNSNYQQQSNSAIYVQKAQQYNAVPRQQGHFERRPYIGPKTIIIAICCFPIGILGVLCPCDEREEFIPDFREPGPMPVAQPVVADPIVLVVER